MRLFLTIFLPWLSFFTVNRPIAGIIALMLQITLIGWAPAAIWALHSLITYQYDAKIEEMKKQFEYLKEEVRSRLQTNNN